jgi:hypothetical protein
MKVVRTIRRMWRIYKRRPAIVISEFGQATKRPQVTVSLHGGSGAMTLFAYDANDAGQAHATMSARSAGNISGLPVFDDRAVPELRP